jgi:hypothetical protein
VGTPAGAGAPASGVSRSLPPPAGRHGRLAPSGPLASLPPVGLYDWLLFLHVAAAFVLVAALVMLGVVVLGIRRDDGSRAALLGLSPLALLLWDIGGITVLVFGVWLALNVDGYELWDPWIVAAILLWLVAAACGGNLRRLFAERGGAADAPPRAVPFYATMAAATAVLLVVMIYKPGA